MTTRFAMAVALLLLLLAQAWGLVSVWRDDPLRSLAGKEKKEVQGASMPGGRQSLQPIQSATPPDLNQGYIFSGERSLAAGSGRGGQSQNAANVAIDKIHYTGSIITATNPKALLSYALGGQADSSGGGAGDQKQGFLRVAVGDTVNGYKVTEILPEKITFSRDGQQITKLLHDKAKDRPLAPPPLSGREQSGQITAAPPATPPVEKAAEPQRAPAVRKQLKPQVPPPPSDEELRQRPLRKRPEPPPS